MIQPSGREHVFEELSSLLTRLIPDRMRILSYLQEANISTSNIRMSTVSGAAQEIWLDVLDEVHATAQMDTLIGTIRNDFITDPSTRERLDELLRAYRQLDAEEEIPEEEAQSDPLPHPFDSPKAHALQVKVLVEVYKEPRRALDAIRNMMRIHDDIGGILEQMRYVASQAEQLSRMENDVSVLRERWESSQAQVSRGIIPAEEFQREENSIRRTVLDTLDRMQSSLESEY